MRSLGRLPTRLVRRLAQATLAVAALTHGAACRPVPHHDWFLVEKGPYQILYSPDGKIERLVYDKNADGRADMVVFFEPDGAPARSQIDTDLDGVVDRWEHVDARGRLVKVGRAQRTPGVPDAWDILGASGETTRREFDEDGDGAVDRAEYLSDGRVFLEELDTDHDARADRRIVRGPAGEVLRVEADTEEVGAWKIVAPTRR